jgi:hypothetical protein
MHVVFADTRWGVIQAQEFVGHGGGGAELVALSAEALETANALGLSCQPIGRVISGGRRIIGRQREAFQSWVHALTDLETALAAEIQGCRFEGPGILLSRAYPIALAINAVRYRAGLMIEAVKALRASEVTVIETYRDLQFDGDGYDFNPWTLAFKDWGSTRGIRNRAAFFQSPEVRPSLYLRGLAWARKQPFLRRWKRAIDEYRSGPLFVRRSADSSNMRILFSDSMDYDWSPIYRRLKSSGARLYLLECGADDRRVEDKTYLRKLQTGQEGILELSPSVTDSREVDQQKIGEVFNCWAEQTAWRSKLTFSEVDTFRALCPYIRSLAMTGPALLHRTDALVVSALDISTPQAVCFFVIAYPYQKRLAFECNRRGIPVMCYQHGGAYGTHEVPVQDLIDGSFADVFLVYGRNINPPTAPVIPRRAKYVPTGSARIEMIQQAALETQEARRHSPTQESKLRVLFAGDVSFGNTITAGTEIEDTGRHLLEVRSLSMLAQSDSLKVTYRPFPVGLTAQGTPDWLRRTRLLNIGVDATSKTTTLLKQTDLVLTLSTSGTLWNEVMASGIPLVAYVNPIYTGTRDQFIRDLASACIVCDSDEGLGATIEQIVAEGKCFLDRFADKAAKPFLREYVLGDGACADSVMRLLAETCKYGSAAMQPDNGAHEGATTDKDDS